MNYGSLFISMCRVYTVLTACHHLGLGVGDTKSIWTGIQMCSPWTWQISTRCLEFQKLLPLGRGWYSRLFCAVMQSLWFKKNPTTQTQQKNQTKPKTPPTKPPKPRGLVVCRWDMRVEQLWPAPRDVANAHCPLSSWLWLTWCDDTSVGRAAFCAVKLFIYTLLSI